MSYLICVTNSGLERAEKVTALVRDGKGGEGIE